jgi:hypothetical protein
LKSAIEQNRSEPHAPWAGSWTLSRSNAFLEKEKIATKSEKIASQKGRSQAEEKKSQAKGEKSQVKGVTTSK